MRFARLFSLIVLTLFISVSELTAADNPEALSRFRFDGIAYDSNDPNKSIAMINGIALHVGDEYRDFKVLEIAEGHVVLSSVETKEFYELSPGDGNTNVQKRETWNPLANLKIPQMPKAPAAKSGTLAGAAKSPEAKKAEANEALKKLNPFNTLLESKEKVEKQIDEIKAVQNERIDLLNNIMDGMEPKTAEEKK